MIQRMAVFLIVFMVGFVLVSSALTTTAKGDYQVNYNDRVSLSAIETTFESSTDPGDCGSGYVGQFSFDARLTNTSDNPITNLVAEVVTLSNNNMLENADGGAGGAGAVLTILESDDYSDGKLSTGEYVDVHFNICLADWESFEFLVDILGLSIGDEGPASGIVFYIEDTGVNGLEAAPEDQNSGSGVEWGCQGTEILGADGIGVGTGTLNTYDILAGCSTIGIAAEVAADYSLGGETDWFLPSRRELRFLFRNRAVVGGFTRSLYWSSTEFDRNRAWAMRFRSRGGGMRRVPKSNPTAKVRAIRAF